MEHDKRWRGDAGKPVRLQPYPNLKGKRAAAGCTVVLSKLAILVKDVHVARWERSTHLNADAPDLCLSDLIILLSVMILHILQPKWGPPADVLDKPT